MPDITEQRKLAAIMFTDMVGYSALSQRDDKLALELLEEHRQLLREILPRFNGTEIKTIGDAFLIEFSSALEAAQCAIEIQRALAKRNHDVTPDRHIELKIGIHIGDVVHRGGDVYGDGVNIASRIEPLAGAGGICVSMDVERQIRNALEARFEKLAPVELKNISVSMDLFRIVLPWERKPGVRSEICRDDGQIEDSRWRKSEIRRISDASRKKAALIGALLLLLIVGIGWWWITRSHKTVPPRQNASAARTEGVAAIPEKSIAVLPFENLSAEKANAFFADGVQDEILTYLAKIADVKVISRTSVTQYKTGVARNLRKIGEELGVAHVVEGSVQRAANQIRVNAQLVDARNDTHLWAQTYDRDLADVFAIQTEIAKAIADQLQAKLSPREQATIERRPTTDLGAFELYSRAKNVFLATPVSNREAGYLEAIDYLEKALARDPSFVQAYCLLAHAHDDLYFYGIDHTPERLRQAEAAVATALRLDPESGDAHLARAEHLYHGYRDYDGALAEIQIAARSLPNDPRIFEWTGYIIRRRDQQQDGLPYFERAFELDPRNINTAQQIALTYQTTRRYREAVARWDRALAIKPDQIETRVWRAQIELDWKADTAPLHQTIEDIRGKEPAAIHLMANSMFLLALTERDIAAAEIALVALGNNPFGYDQMLFTPKMNEGLIARMANDQERARAAFTAARQQQEKIVQTQPEYAAAVCLLGIIDAALGRKEEALREGRRAIDLVPLAKDAAAGGIMIQWFSVIAAWVGEKDLALEYLQRAVRLPSYTITTYGQLKLLPIWDPLRGDPRFEKIVASLAPKRG